MKITPVRVAGNYDEVLLDEDSMQIPDWWMFTIGHRIELNLVGFNGTYVGEPLSISWDKVRKKYYLDVPP